MDHHRTSWTLLIIALVLILAGSLLGSWVNTGAGAATVQDIKIYGTNGYVISAYLYTPKSASAQKPADRIQAIDVRQRDGGESELLSAPAQVFHLHRGDRAAGRHVRALHPARVARHAPRRLRMADVHDRRPVRRRELGLLGLRLRAAGQLGRGAAVLGLETEARLRRGSSPSGLHWIGQFSSLGAIWLVV